ncbi:hypothetical protein RGU70_09700 [Herbaspirillum sp. RTI4]|uniref:hypothetical protein n=1 Tax=Herbaspirillum sp. RTI4 TaxID=3048640 RepID=UPI002AB47BF9|nr:hypothetical protein [Herbaspirillum sp. RTI4]MDY7578597.1 hypothetical protein [Herbaspirillum sp. RTI4]MEA9981097.1 hypothetical protein [Herbaspirillum sp. RTI4]
MKKHDLNRFVPLCLFLAGMVAGSACATEKVPLETPSVISLVARYPTGSITSVAVSEQILTETDSERQALEIRNIQNQRACYQRFFVSSCLNDAKDIYSSEKKAIRDVEIQANSYQRQARVDERDKDLADQREANEADAADRLRQQQEKTVSNAAKTKESAQKLQDQQAKDQQPQISIDQRVAEHNAKINAIRAQEAADASQRASNVRDYNDKVKAAAEHKLEVEQKKAAKLKEIARKKDQEKPPVPAPAAP